MPWYKKHKIHCILTKFKLPIQENSVRLRKMAVYDEEKKLWQSTTRPFDDDTEFSPGQRILNAISKHGSKLAQVSQNIFSKDFENHLIVYVIF